MGPIVKLANAILLSALSKGARTIWIQRGVVVFTIDDVDSEEMRVPVALYAGLVRRLSVMASLPAYTKGTYAEGMIRLLIDIREVFFAIRVEGHGDDMQAMLVVLRSEDELAERERL